MDEAKMKETVVEAVASAFNDQPSRTESCPIGIDREQHAADHRVIQSIAKILDRVDNIKWGVAKSLSVTLVIFLGGAVIVGAFVIAKTKIGNMP